MTVASVDDFIDAQSDEQVRDHRRVIIKMMSAATGDKPAMWGPGIVGFGSVPLKYASGRELDRPVCAFSPPKAKLKLYRMDGYEECTALLKKLGKHSIGKSCLYIKRLSDVDETVLKELIGTSARMMSKS